MAIGREFLLHCFNSGENRFVPSLRDNKTLFNDYLIFIDVNMIYKLNRYSFISLIGLLSLFLVGCTGRYNCNNSDSLVAEDTIPHYIEDSDDKLANDSTMIGTICLGMNKQVFNKAKSEFLRENTEISGLKIAKMQGYFYKGKLVRVVITSDSHHNWYGGIEESYECSAWTDLYKKKYRVFNDDEIDSYGFSSTIFSKGRCLIIVTDQDPINDLPTSWDIDVFWGIEDDIDSNTLELKRLKIKAAESKVRLNQTPGSRVSEKRFSRIDVIDKNLYINTLNERCNDRAKRKRDRMTNELDLI